jgi:hypothetical protein
MNGAIENAKSATEITKIVFKHYNDEKTKQFEERRRIEMLPTEDELSASDRLVVERPPDVENTEAMQTALQMTYSEISRYGSRLMSFCTFEESVASISGGFPSWKWHVNEWTKEVQQAQQLAHLERVRNTLLKYRSDTQAYPSDSIVIDLASPIQSYVEKITKGKYYSKDSDEGADWVGFDSAMGCIKASEKVLAWFETRVQTAVSHVNEFIRTMANTMYHGYILALEWTGVFFEHNMKVTDCKMPRKGISIAHVLKLLSCAAAHNGIHFAESETDHKDVQSTGKDNTCVFSILRSSEGNRIDMCSVDALVAFAEMSQESWRCFCTMASLTKSLLVYNRELTFDAKQIAFDESTNSISVSFCNHDFLLIHDELVQSHKSDISLYRTSIAPEIDSYPPHAKWTFSDEHWTTHGAFKVLLTWLPDAAHFTKGFFPFSGVRDRPDKKNGFLNVQDSLHESSKKNEAQYWDGVCAHPLASTHGRLPTDMAHDD